MGSALVVAGVLAATSFVAAPSHAAKKNYGCFKVVGASSLAIRKSPWVWSRVIGYASRGKKLEKRRRFCSIRRTWCPVRLGKIEGWSGTRYLEKIDC